MSFNTLQKTYRSAISWGFIAWIGLILLPITGLTILQGAWLASILLILTLAFVYLMLFSFRYTITNDQVLEIRGILYKKRIQISDIKKLSFSRNLLASPAASLKRMEVRYHTRDFVLISPDKPLDFIEQILRINPEVQVHYPGWPSLVGASKD